MPLWDVGGSRFIRRANRTDLPCALDRCHLLWFRLTIAAGDVETARVVHEAIGLLLGAPAPQGEVATNLVDLARERDRGAR
ncbi:hypothetical protein WMF14_33395 [Sorangium sp. So ce693]